jgi:protease-4
MKLRHWAGIVLLGLAALIVLPWAAHKVQHRASDLSKDLDLGPGRVAILPITGEIQDSAWAVHWLKRFGHDVRGVKAIVLALDTPGGGVAPSQEICQQIWRLRDDGVVVVASMGSMAASGGYYIASACDEIVANPGTITGSIGVIMETVHVEDLLRKVGAKFETIKSGEFKDSGSFNRAMTPRERALFQGAINDVYEQFVDAVYDGRREALADALGRQRHVAADKLSEAQVRAYAHGLADGRIYTGRQAHDLGLVDSLGGLEDAIDRAAELAGLDEPNVITYREPRSIAEWMTGMNKSEMKAWVHGAILGQGPSLNYLLR